MVLSYHSPLSTATDIPHGEQMMKKINKNEPLTKSRAEAASSQPVHSKAKYSPDAPSGVQGYAALLASLFLFLPDITACPPLIWVPTAETWEPET